MFCYCDKTGLKIVATLQRCALQHTSGSTWFQDSAFFFFVYFHFSGIVPRISWYYWQQHVWCRLEQAFLTFVDRKIQPFMVERAASRFIPCHSIPLCLECLVCHVIKQNENKMQSYVIYLLYVLIVLWASYYRLLTKQVAICLSYESERNLKMLMPRLNNFT